MRADLLCKYAITSIGRALQNGCFTPEAHRLVTYTHSRKYVWAFTAMCRSSRSWNERSAKMNVQLICFLGSSPSKEKAHNETSEDFANAKLYTQENKLFHTAIRLCCDRPGSLSCEKKKKKRVPRGIESIVWTKTEKHLPFCKD